VSAASVASTSPAARTSHRQAPSRSLLDSLRRPGSLLAIGILIVGIGCLFWRWFVNQNGHSWGNGDWSHAYMVPFISGALVWRRQRELGRTRFLVFWPGLIPLLMGVWGYVYFIAGVPNHFGQGLALVLTIFGLTLLLLGPRAMEECFTAIAFLVFGITVPEMIMNLLTYPLQDWAASGGYFLLRLVGVNADLAGNSITVYDLKTGNPVPLTVAEQCSGMRTVIAFLALGTCVALMGTNQWWRRVVLVATAAPIAVGLNAARIAVLGFMSQYNPKFSEGEAHILIGTLLLVPGFFFYMGVRWALNKAAPEGDAREPAPPRKIARSA